MSEPAETIITYLREALPDIEAVFLFGSESEGTADANSDLDIALLSNHPLDAVTLWDTAAELASRVHRDVDLLDASAASTVMKFQIATKGDILWQKDHAGDLFACAALQEYWDWEITRRPIIERIQETGTVYGR